MCTVVLSVRPDRRWPVVALAIRDEHLDRPWDPFGPWWPRLGRHVVGLRDREAGGAWLAVNTVEPAMAVVLNRTEPLAEPPAGWATRGTLPLAAVTGGPELPEHPATRAFNLLSTSGPGAVRWTGWAGGTPVTRALPPGVHVVAAADPDDPELPRVARWLPAFRAAAAPTGPLPAGDGGWEPWLDVLRASTALAPDHDEALLRAHSIEGRPFGSLLVAAVAVAADGVALDFLPLPRPGRLPDRPDWTSACAVSV